MPQTRFVTRKALALGLKPIVVVNKVDRPGARSQWVVNQTFELFDKLGASEEQLDFPVVYASALHGYASLDPDDAGHRHAAAVRDDPGADPGARRRSRGTAAAADQRARLFELRRPARHRPHPPRPAGAGAGSDGPPRQRRPSTRSKIGQVLGFSGLERVPVEVGRRRRHRSDYRCRRLEHRHHASPRSTCPRRCR